MANTIKISVLGDVRDINRKMGDVNNKLSGFGKATSKVGRLLKNTFLLAGTAYAASKVTGFITGSIDAARESNRVAAQTGAVLKSTGHAANVSAKQVAQLATALSMKTGIDDEVIQSGENLLLTFRGIRNEVGKGNDIFNRATVAVTDMSAALGQDTKSSAIQLGKALNDPIKGITALRRVGIAFTASQQKQIKALVESGHTLKAQKIILGEIKKEFGGSAEALATPWDKLKVKLGNVQEDLGNVLIPMLDKLATYVSAKVVPKLEDFTKWLKSNRDEIKSTAQNVSGALLPPLKVLGQLAASLAKLFNSLPAPVRKFGLELLVGAVAVSKLSSAFGGMKLSGFISDLRNTETRMDAVGRAGYKIGSALRGLAGGAGLMLLAANAKTTSKSMGALGGAAGGALLGFSLGGPIGAAIGAGAGALYGLTTATDNANNALSYGQKVNLLYKNSLDQMTGSITAQTKAIALKQLKANKESSGYVLMNQLGIPDRAQLNAMTGSVKNYESLKQRLGAAQKAGLISPADARNALGYITRQRQAIRGDVADRLKDIAVTKDYGKTLNALPKAKRIKVEATGIVPTVKGIAQVAERIHATPKEIKTLINASGVDTTIKGVQRVIDKDKDAKKQAAKPYPKANTASWVKSLTDSITSGRKVTGSGATAISNNLARSGHAKAQGGGFLSSLSGIVSQGKSIASSGGSGIGSNLGSGVAAGIGKWVGAVAAAAAHLVNNAVAAANTAGQIFSPSRKMKKVGKNLALGLIKGWRDQSKHILNLSAGDVTGLIKRTTATFKKYGKPVGDTIKSLEKRLLGNANARARNNATLKKEQDALKTLQDSWYSYRDAVSDSARQFGSITSGNAAFNSDAMINSMQARLTKVRQFQSVINTLVSQGLNKTTIDDLMQAGVEGGLGYAQALATGGKQAITEINSLQASLNATAASLGTKGADSMYRAGINAAKGIIRGLNTANLAAVGKRIASALVTAIKNRLGIHSPSRVFADIGLQSLKGIEVGLKDTSGVKRSMVRLGDAMTDSFDPKLQATAKTGSKGDTVTLTFNVPPTADKAAIGREVAGALDAYYKQGGRRLSL